MEITDELKELRLKLLPMSKKNIVNVVYVKQQYVKIMEPIFLAAIAFAFKKPGILTKNLKLVKDLKNIVAETMFAVKEYNQEYYYSVLKYVQIDEKVFEKYFNEIEKKLKKNLQEKEK